MIGNQTRNDQNYSILYSQDMAAFSIECNRFGADEAVQAKKVASDLSAEKNSNSNDSVNSGNTYINMCIPINSVLTINNDQTIEV